MRIRTILPLGTVLGGPDAPAPGGTSDATVELQPGNHALIGLIPSSDGAPRVMKEITRPLTAARRDLRSPH